VEHRAGGRGLGTAGGSRSGEGAVGDGEMVAVQSDSRRGHETAGLRTKVHAHDREQVHREGGSGRRAERRW